ncbi:hypothetical protein EBX93_18495, partial [bacterium]|nr:hypothetical protein [bacterium]
IESIRSDWVNNRCKPHIMPFAGVINKPPDKSIAEYTAQNFQECSQNIQSSMTGYALEPITFALKQIQTEIASSTDAVNSFRAMFDKIRNFTQTFTEEAMNRTINTVVPIQEVFIKMKDMLGKIQGTLTASFFTTLASYDILKSFMGSLAQLIVTVLIAMAAMIGVFWISPFTWGVAASTSAVFLAVSVPMAVVLTYMMHTLHIQTNMKLPSLPTKMKCFDENTLLQLNDGSSVKICDIKLGDNLIESYKSNTPNTVTCIIKVPTTGSTMYSLNEVIVSDTHSVFYKGQYIKVQNHPDAILLKEYHKPYLYCINTLSKNIKINGMIFADWDTLYGKDIYDIVYVPKQFTPHVPVKRINVYD